MNRTTERAAENSAEFAEAILAHRITDGAIKYALHLHTLTGMRDTTFADTSWMDGSYTASITTIESDTVQGTHILQFLVVGEFGDASDTSRVQLLSRSLLVPEITASLGIQSDTSLFSFSGNAFSIQGNDQCGDAPPVSGLTFSSTADSINLVDAIPNINTIQGAGSSPSVGVDGGSSTDLAALVAYYGEIADITLLADGVYNNQNWGTPDSPVVIYGPGNLDLRSCNGYGVLAVNGSLTLRGNLVWHGLIIAEGGDSLHVDATVGNPSINGAIFLGARMTQLTLKGSVEFNYCSDDIQMVRDGLVGRDRRTVTDTVWWE